MQTTVNDNQTRIQIRELVTTTAGIPASDGAGVKLTRIIASPELDHIDPFLLLDRFESEDAKDYIAGFPAHPHRGFETVTYLLDGRMRHKDNAGHEGVIEPGGVQWMTAGRGIIHSEMPEQEDGLLRGFQLWVNLPAREKMTAPTYHEYAASDIPIETLTGGGKIKVIAGKTDLGTEGPVIGRATDPLYFDVLLPPRTTFRQHIAVTHSAFVYVIDGTVTIGESLTPLKAGELGILGAGNLAVVDSADQEGRFLFIAGRQLNEPIQRMGPFVMNTKQELLQAADDYRNGRF